MPRGTKVHECVEKLTGKGMASGKAIRICQSATGQGYASGKTKTEEGKPVGGRKHKGHRSK